MLSCRCRAFYLFTVSVKMAVLTTGGTVDSACTLTDDTLKVGVHCGPQPVNRPRPIALTASTSSICKRRRFLKPRKQQSAVARAVPGISGLELERAMYEFAPAVIVSVPFATGVPFGVIVSALHVAPLGSPAQVTFTFATKGAVSGEPLTTISIVPLSPAVRASAEAPSENVKSGTPALMTYLAVATSLLVYPSSTAKASMT